LALHSRVVRRAPPRAALFSPSNLANLNRRRGGLGAGSGGWGAEGKTEGVGRLDFLVLPSKSVPAQRDILAGKRSSSS
jgi:hypothetical protein